MTFRELLIRYIAMIPGVFILCFGIAFITKAGLGTSPISSIPYSMSLILPRFTMGNYMIIMNVVMAAGFVALFLNPTNNPVFLIGASFVGSLGFGAPAICYGMVGDSLEYGDWKLGKRQEGLAASMLSFGVKLATAICAPVVLLLEAVGYVPNQQQTPSTQMGINFMVNMLPAILALVSCIPLIWYKLSDKRVSEIRADLEAGKHAWDK